MSWIEKLYETYEHCLGNPSFSNEKNKLLPINHAFQQAHIEVCIDSTGTFIRAEVLPKKEIILPSTEDSAGRSGSKNAPHALADKLHYCAGDYFSFGGSKPSYFDSYVKQLNAWCNSEFMHPKALAVLNYLQKCNLISDLVKHKILHLDDNGLLLAYESRVQSETYEIFKRVKDQGDALICWRVYIPEDEQDATWKDESLFNAWVNYSESVQKNKGFCYVLGREQFISIIHPRRIRNSADSAKIISSNDKSGFTFMGKFTDFTQACEVGSEVSQKAHSALRWLIARQGAKQGDQVYVAWAVTGTRIPKPLINTFDLFEQALEGNIQENTLDFIEDERYQENVFDVGQTFALRLNKLISGYRVTLEPTEDIVVMGLGSASPGRISIIYYRELSGSEFLERIEKWHSNFSWVRCFEKADENNKKNKKIRGIFAPSPAEIAKTAFGEKIDDKLKKNIIERLLPCIVDEAAIPFDLVKMTVNRVTNRESFASDFAWEEALGITCALYKGFYLRHQNINERKRYKMSLESSRNSRDYLYGRLLALAEHLESKALFLAGEKRQTNAAKLMKRFSDKPMDTWKILENGLLSYKARVSAKWPGYLRKCETEIDGVFALFQPGDFERSERLSGEFLLGYHCQRYELNNKNEVKKQVVNELSLEEIEG